MNFDPITRPYSGDAHRAMSDLREMAFAQSAATRDGQAAPFGERYAREQMMDGPPDPIPNYADRRGV